jgi:hypothetical protein
VLRSGIPVALATDSALTAPVDLLDELRVASRYQPLEHLYSMVTRLPARILRLPPSQDWVAVRSSARVPARALLDGEIALVVVRGRVRLIAPDLAAQLPRALRAGFEPLAVEGRREVLVDANVRRLYRAAARYLGPSLRLAGKRVLA